MELLAKTTRPGHAANSLRNCFAGAARATKSAVGDPRQNGGPMSVQSGTKRKEGGFAETVRVVFHALIIIFSLSGDGPSGRRCPTNLIPTS